MAKMIFFSIVHIVYIKGFADVAFSRFQRVQKQNIKCAEIQFVGRVSQTHSSLF